jgi:hypothetical protein
MFSRSGTRPALLVAQNRDEVVEPDVVGGARHCPSPVEGLNRTLRHWLTGATGRSDDYRIARFRHPPSDNVTLGRISVSNTLWANAPWEHPDWYDIHDTTWTAGPEREPEHYRSW